jgi:hypothetical protein
LIASRVVNNFVLELCILCISVPIFVDMVINTLNANLLNFQILFSKILESEPVRLYTKEIIMVQRNEESNKYITTQVKQRF